MDSIATEVNPGLFRSARSVSRILAKAVEQRDTARITALFFRLLDPSHVTQCCLASLVRWHAGSDVILDKVIPVISQLLVELMFYLAASEQRTNAQAKLTSPAHGRRLLKQA
jgi:hypothetical protein